MAGHPKTSAVWESFKPVQKNRKVMSVTCIHCNNKYKYFGNTTNLRDHLKRKHPDQLVNPLEDSASHSETVTPTAGLPSQPPIRKRRRRNRTSSVWEFFTRIVQNKKLTAVTCKLCNQSFNHSRNTTNLHNHLRRNHSAEEMMVAPNDEDQCVDDFQKSKSPHTTIPYAFISESFTKICVNNMVKVICKYCNNDFKYADDMTNLLDHLEQKHPNILLEIQRNSNKPVETITIVQDNSFIPDNENNGIDKPFEEFYNTFLPDESSQTKKQFNGIEYFETTVFPEDCSEIGEQANESHETFTMLAEEPSAFGKQTDEIDESCMSLTELAEGPSNLGGQIDEIDESLQTVTTVTERPSCHGGQTSEMDKFLKTGIIPSEEPLSLEQQGNEIDGPFETITVYMDEPSETAEQCAEIEECCDIDSDLREGSLHTEPQFDEVDESIYTVTTALPEVPLKTKTINSLSKSIVWDCFHKVIKNKKISSAVCKYCYKRYQYFGNTTNLYKHLRMLHPNRLRNQEGLIEIVESQVATATNGVSKIKNAKLESKHSRVWQYFKKSKKNEKKVVLKCKQCNKIYRNFGNTSNLLKHLRSAHSIQLTKVHNQKNISFNTNEYLIALPVKHVTKPSVLQPKAKDKEVENSENSNYPTGKFLSFDLKQRSEPTSDEIRKFEKDLIHMIAVDSQPLSLIENPGFRFFIGEYMPWYKLPSQETLTEKVLPEVYNSLRDNFKAMLEKTEHISITTDMWQSDRNKTYVTVRAHFIYEFKTIYLVLSTEEVKNDVAEIIIDIFTKWEITNKIVSVVTDNVASMETMVSNLGRHCIPCIIHVLNSSVQEAIKQTKRLETVLSKFLATKFKGDSLAVNILKQLQRVKGLVTVTYNFTFIIESLSKIQESLSGTLSSLDDPPISFDKYESDAINDFIQILKLLSLMIEDLSKEKYPTISRTMLLLKGLQGQIKKKHATTDIGRQLKLSFYMIISRRFDFLESIEPIAKAIFLDPRFKTAAFASQQTAGTAQNLVTKELIKLIQNSKEPTPSPSNSTNTSNELWNHFDEKISAITSTTTPEASAKLIIKRYLEMPYVNRKKDPLEFWKTHFNTFPNLFLMACKYLSIPGTSVPTDLIFSKDGVIIDDKRRRLPSTGLNELLFISENVKSSKQKSDLQWFYENFKAVV